MVAPPGCRAGRQIACQTRVLAPLPISGNIRNHNGGRSRPKVTVTDELNRIDQEVLSSFFAHASDGAQRNMLLRSSSEQMSVTWRASMIDIRSGAESLRARHVKELGDAGAKTVDRLITASQKLEATFAQIKSQIQATLAASKPGHP